MKGWPGHTVEALKQVEGCGGKGDAAPGRSLGRGGGQVPPIVSASSGNSRNEPLWSPLNEP
eukprot:1012870-Alexandrium_andersonii.AAC.1